MREVVLNADALGTINTAVFRDVRDNYEITENANGTTTVAHIGDFGTDTLRNSQRLQFGPGATPEVVVLPINAPLVNCPATGQPVILGAVVENVRVIVSFNDGFVPPVNESVTSNPVGPVVSCTGPGCGPPPVDEPPAAPTALTATGGVAQISLGWNANTDADLAGYRLYRSETSPVDLGAVPVAQPAAGATSYVDTSAVPGTTYHYALVAVDDDGNLSSASNEASAAATAPPVVVSRFEQDDPSVVVSAGWAGVTRGSGRSVVIQRQLRCRCDGGGPERVLTRLIRPAWRVPSARVASAARADPRPGPGDSTVRSCRR